MFLVWLSLFLKTFSPNWEHPKKKKKSHACFVFFFLCVFYLFSLRTRFFPLLSSTMGSLISIHCPAHKEQLKRITARIQPIVSRALVSNMGIRIPFIATKREDKLYQMLKTNLAFERLHYEQRSCVRMSLEQWKSHYLILRHQLRLPLNILGTRLAAAAACQESVTSLLQQCLGGCSGCGRALANDPVCGGVWLNSSSQPCIWCGSGCQNFNSFLPAQISSDRILRMKNVASCFRGHTVGVASWGGCI